MTFKINLWFWIFAVGTGFLFLSSQTSFAQNTTKDVMKFKLHHAQRVLEGIATENFEVIADNAEKLKKLSKQAEWHFRQTPEYQRFTTEFARHAEALSQAAKKENVDAATVAYFQMTVSCTSCHRYLRGTRAVGLNPPLNLKPSLVAKAVETSKGTE